MHGKTDALGSVLGGLIILGSLEANLQGENLVGAQWYNFSTAGEHNNIFLQKFKNSIKYF